MTEMKLQRLHFTLAIFNQAKSFQCNYWKMHLHFKSKESYQETKKEKKNLHYK